MPTRISLRAHCFGLKLGSAASLCAALLALPASAATITFNTDPFLGSNALVTPGRQVFAGLQRTLPSFDQSADRFVFDSAVFGFNAPLSFVNSLAIALPTLGANVMVLQDTDNDNNPATGFNAGSAANLIAAALGADGAGFFVYHNSALQVNRLVYSTNLNDANADLSVLARINSPSGSAAIDALTGFSSSNFTATVPEPSSMALLAGGLVAAVARRRRRVSAVTPA